jgi:hypothetical protein
MTNKLLPYIGSHPTIKRLNGVNSPASMCMPGIACSRSSCNANAFYEHDSNPYCLRHHTAALKSNPDSTPKSKSKSKLNSTSESNEMEVVKCVAELQTGKNKGQQCNLNAMQWDTVPHLCKKHSKCNTIVYQMH